MSAGSEKQGKPSFAAMKDALLLRVATKASTKAGLRVGMGLATFLNTETGTAWPSTAQLGKAIGMSARNARRGLTDVVEDGLYKLVGSRKGGIRQFNGPTDKRKGITAEYKPVLENADDYCPPFDRGKADKKHPIHGQERPDTRTTVVRQQDERLDERLDEPLPSGSGEHTRPRSSRLNLDDPFSCAGQMVEIWCHEAPSCRQPQNLLADRAARLHRSFRDDFGGSPGRWRTFCRRVEASSFLTGDNERGWVVDIDWACKPANVLKIIEGKL